MMQSTRRGRHTAKPPKPRALAFPLRALIERINSNEDPPWASYLSAGVVRAERSVRQEEDRMQDTLPRLLGARKIECGLGNLSSGGCCGGRDIVLTGGVAGSITGGMTGGMTSLVGRVWELSQDSKGCRDVQLALEQAGEDLRRLIVAEVAGHVLDAMRCPHANHVLQKCITSSRPADCQFIIDEIMACNGFVELAARHKYGCRIIQRLLERCSTAQVECVANAILSDVSGIARHPYGNYVLQNLLEHGTPAHRHKLAEELRKEIVPICQDSFGSAVVAAALSQLCKEDAISLARAIVQEQGLLTFMAHARHGHSAVRLLLQALDGPDLARARELLCAELPSLKVSRYGRIVASWLDAEGRKSGAAGDLHGSVPTFSDWSDDFARSQGNAEAKHTKVFACTYSVLPLCRLANLPVRTLEVKKGAKAAQMVYGLATSSPCHERGLQLGDRSEVGGPSHDPAGSMSTCIQITEGVVPGINRLALKGHMEQFGQVDLVHMGNRQNPEEVRFSTPEAAQALEAINAGQVVIDGMLLKAQYMQGKGRGRGAPPTATERNLEAVTSSWSVSAPELQRGAEVEVVERSEAAAEIAAATAVEGRNGRCTEMKFGDVQRRHEKMSGEVLHHLSPCQANAVEAAFKLCAESRVDRQQTHAKEHKRRILSREGEAVETHVDAVDASLGAMAELTARERRLVHMTSNIFDEKGSDKSVYSASRQKELLENLRQSYVQKNGAPEAMNLPRPQEMKYALMSGNHAVLPASSAVNGPGTKRDAQFMPKEFWSTSVDLKWHDVRNERCRHKSHAAERANLDAKDKKTREMSSELFQKERLVNRTMGKSDLVADGTDYLALDSSLHEQHGTVPGGATGRRSSASQRQQANLAASGYNTMPQPEVAPEVTGGYAQEHPARCLGPGAPPGRRSGKEMRNYSDLFGSEMGRRPAPTQQRQDIIGTSTCTFLDHRGEIEAARREEGRLAGATTPANRKEAEMSSTLHGHKTPRGQKAPELEQALAVERGVWDSKEGMAINAEVSRRHREKEFNKDFEGDVFHLSRKQDCLDSSQVRENIGQPAPIEAPVSPRSGAGLMSPYSPTRQGGPSAAKREKMLQFAKDTKLASLQSSIFS
ncbi:APUM1 [Symbiodinium microadriaticum]|nr:APUM1 [Symbiodinium microadriaticum]